jgi:hypothetical protein
MAMAARKNYNILLLTIILKPVANTDDKQGLIHGTSHRRRLS